jgi:WD40 repeat protein
MLRKQVQLNSAAFSCDGARIVIASNMGAFIWDGNAGTEILVLRGHEGALASAAFSPDGARIVTASLDNTARIWDAGNGRMPEESLTSNPLGIPPIQIGRESL